MSNITYGTHRHGDKVIPFVIYYILDKSDPSTMAFAYQDTDGVSGLSKGDTKITYRSSVLPILKERVSDSDIKLIGKTVNQGFSAAILSRGGAVEELNYNPSSGFADLYKQGTCYLDSGKSFQAKFKPAVSINTQFSKKRLTKAPSAKKPIVDPAKCAEVKTWDPPNTPLIHPILMGLNLKSESSIENDLLSALYFIASGQNNKVKKWKEINGVPLYKVDVNPSEVSNPNAMDVKSDYWRMHFDLNQSDLDDLAKEKAARAK